mgnify:CR=1 FL=1
MQGSLWRRWDLHLHTPASFYQKFKISRDEKDKYDGDIWQKYFDELEKISDVAVLGITDYFTIDGYKKVLEYKSQGNLENIEIMPNIEFRLDQVGGDGKKVNYHVIFSNELEPEVIEREFLEKLEIISYSDMEPRTLCRTNIEEVGKFFKEDTGDSGSNFEVGCKHTHVSLRNIIQILEEKKSIFGGKYLLVLAERGWDTLKFEDQKVLDQAAQIKRAMLFPSHAVFSSNPDTIKWMLGEKGITEKKFKRIFKSLKPCIHGSDAHSFDKICKPDEDRYCWIKADTTFEGLRTIVFDPKERVKIQKDNPNHRKSIHTISSIKISNSDINEELSIKEGSISLNENLVAITGGKGTGKTALLDLIANCFEDRCIRSKTDIPDKNSFVQRIQANKDDLNIQIEFSGNSVDSFSKNITEKSLVDSSKITYLPQGRIEDYSSDQELLDEKIEDIIFKNDEIRKMGCKDKFYEIKDELTQIKRELGEINFEIHELEEETKKEIIEKFETKLKIKYGDLEDKEDEYSKFKETVDDDLSSKIKALKEKERKLKADSYALSDTRNRLEVFDTKLNDFLEDKNADIHGINVELEKLGINFGLVDIDFNAQFISIEEAIKLLDEEIECKKNEINEIESQQDKLSDDELAEAKLIEEINGIEDSIEVVEEILFDLKEKEEDIKTYEDERSSNYLNLLNKYLEWDKYYKKVITIFSDGKDKILNDIRFESNIYFDNERFITKGNEIMDGRKIEKESLISLSESLQNLLDNPSFDDVTDFIKEINSIKKFLREKKLDNQDFYKWVFDDYFSLRTNVFFNDRSMEKLSMGQKGTVLLKLFLAEGEYPLIVDQPEDNLDNKFIYNELVGAFRDAKVERQIIIATNNANLLVNTDAEQVIVAEFDNNKIFYECGSLENPNTRAKIIPILEGGKRAFREREEKYGI